MRRRIVGVLSAGVLATLAGGLVVPIAGQNPANAKNSGAQKQNKRGQEPAGSTPKFVSTSDLVNVLFTVYDHKKRMVVDLTKDDVTVLENDRPQKIQSFSRESDLPLRIGILIDTSNSVRERLHFEQEAAIDFLNAILRPGKDMAFVVSFDAETQLVQDYTDDEDKLSEAIRHLQAGGATSLFDAVYFASKEKMLYFPPPEPYLRRVLILISDGNDNQSVHLREEALSMAQRGEVTIYAISTNRSTNEGSESERGDKVLQRFAQATGGRVFYPFAASDMSESFQEISRELRSQYSLAYVPSNKTHDGSFRKITIEAHNKQFRVHAKSGYFYQ